jgi:mevalonate kinase
MYPKFSNFTKENIPTTLNFPCDHTAYTSRTGHCMGQVEALIQDTPAHANNVISVLNCITELNNTLISSKYDGCLKKIISSSSDDFLLHF